MASRARTLKVFPFAIKTLMNLIDFTSNNRNQFKAFPVVDLPFFEIEKEREKRLELDLDIVSDEMEARHFSIWVSSFHSMSEN